MLTIAALLAVGVAWWREGLGGVLLVLVGVAHIVFASLVASHNQGFAMLVSGGPFLLAGILFLLSWNRPAPSPY